MKKDLLIVVPYRNREEHLKGFLENSPKYFDQQNFSYDVLICELDQIGDWNAGLCVNSVVDFLKRGKEYTWLYIHHVDIWPTEGKWEFPEEKEVFYNLGDYGSCLMKLQAFLDVNGYCNSFWGWGGEDNDLYTKLRQQGYKWTDMSSGNVKYNVGFQNHQRKFNGRNYANGINILYVQDRATHNSILDFNEHGSVKNLTLLAPNIYKQIVVPKKHSADKHKSKNLLITFTKGQTKFESIAAYVKSACIYSAYSFDFVVVVGDENPDSNFVDQIEAHGGRVFKTTIPIKNLFVDRHKAYKEYIDQNPHYEYILHVDFLDAYFQENPFLQLDPTKLTLVSEDIPIEKQQWNYNTLSSLYSKELIDTFKTKNVICGGVIGAPRNLFIDLGNKIGEEFCTLNTNIGQGIDQPILIKLLYTNKISSDSLDVKHTTDPFCINLHVFKHEKDLVNTKPIINAKTVLTEDRKRYAIVHQFNRFSDLYQNVVKHFTNYFMPVS